VIVEVLAIGTELLLGQIVNTNASTIGARLADAGLDHYHQTVVGDNVERISGTIGLACSRADALIISGGIGPTPDDLTREALCAAAGVEMGFSGEYAEELRVRWQARERQMPQSNLRQAQYPQGADLIPNPKGSAPALRLRIGNTWVFAVPGVPAEMISIIDEQVVPFLRQVAGGKTGVVVSRVLRSWGESEARIAELLADLYDDHVNPTIAFLASSGEIKVRITAKAVDEQAAMTLIAPIDAEVRRRLGPRVYGVDGDSIEAMLIDRLREREWSLATGESATGGMIAARITDVPGASDVYRGSVVAYSESTKTGLLGVDAALIESEGVVSVDVAIAMARGAARSLHADVAISVTGAAGPKPHGRPAGTMIIAVITPEGAQARTLAMPGDRERIRAFTTTASLHLARLAVEGVWWRRGEGHFWVDERSEGE
jgi:nicotinamide-nucleotide amidase